MKKLSPLRQRPVSSLDMRFKKISALICFVQLITAVSCCDCSKNIKVYNAAGQAKNQVRYNKPDKPHISGAQYLLPLNVNKTTEQLSEAIAETEQAFRLDPDNRLLNNRLAKLKAELAKLKGELDRALADITRVIESSQEKDAFHRSIHYTARSYIFEAMGRLPEAIDDAMRALKLDPDSDLRKSRLANLVSHSG